MNHDIAQKWIAELRSGKHAQARHCMKDLDGSMCCLGVLEYVVLGHDRDPITCGVLTLRAKHEAGMHSEDGCSKNYTEAARSSNYHDAIEHGVIHLPSLNDEGTTFSEIADIIEKHWEQL